MQIGGEEKTKMRDRGKQEKFSCIYKVVRAWRLTNSRHFHQVQLFHQFNSTPVVSGHENLTTIISCVERPLEFANLADILKPFSEKNKAGSNKVSKGNFCKLLGSINNAGNESRNED